MSQSLVLRAQALGELLRRYLAIWRAAWVERQRLDGPQRLPHEAAFLPAALALQDTPISPAPRVAMWLIMSFAAIAVTWAWFGRIDVVATAPGKIIASDRTKVIQPLEAAVVQAIHVTDGQAVNAGDLLIELDATAAEADTTRSTSDTNAARLQAARARALLAALDGAPTRLPSLKGINPTALAQAQHQLGGQLGEYRSKLARIDADLTRRQAERQSAAAIVARLEQTVPLARQRAQDYKDLVDKNFMSKHGFLEKEQTRIEQEGELATQQSRIKELEAAIEEGRAQRTALIAETRRLALDSLSEAEQKATAFGQERIKSEQRAHTMRLLAPVDGTVQQLAVHTVGGVVTPAQVLMMVVPQDGALEVEAFVDNKDIGFVSPQQSAVVKIETFQFTKYGTIPATVSQVSHDAISDEKRGLIYALRAQLARATMQIEDKTVNLTPGMAVTVEVKTGQRRVIEYFLSPLLQKTNESLRER